MKKILTLVILVLCAATLFAQAPEKFSYQAVVRNASNQLVASATVGVRVSILQGGVNGTIVYMETQTAVTNANGLITLQIGGGNVQQGIFADIDWANGLYFLKTETDPNGGSDYSVTSVQQLLSVPYALYSKEAGNGFSGDYNDLTNLPQIPQNFSDLMNDAGYITMDSVPTVPTNVSAFTNDAGYLTDYTETDPQFNAWDKDYNDLINKPTIPTVPTDISVFNNDAGYITSQDIPEIPTVPNNVSAFVNDAGYLTGYTETQTLADVTAQGNSAGNRQLKNVSDPTDLQDAATKAYIDQLVNNLTGLVQNLQQQLDSLQNVVNALTGDSNVVDSTGGGAVIDAKSCPSAPTVTDHEGNVYATVQIGDQCWMRDNLRTTTSPSTGTYLIPSAGTGSTNTGKQARWYNNDSATYSPLNYGLLYNWNAAVDTFNTAYGETSVNTDYNNAVSVSFTGHRRGICPAGWHLPSDAEWNTLEATVSGSDWQESYATSTGWRGSHAGKLAGDGWNSSSAAGAPGNAADANHNASGFSAVPAGGCYGSSFDNAGGGATFWFSTQYRSSSAWLRYLGYYNASVSRNFNSKGNGYSVRCLRDETGGGTTQTQPTVTTSAATNISSTSATLNGSVSNPDNVTINAQGFEWKATVNSTYTQVIVSNTTMTYNLTGLTANTNYTYRAYVTTADGTTFGEEINFTTLAAGGGAVIDAKSCPSAPTVTDHEGNMYATVQIGDQCWMRDNLRTTTSPRTGTYLIPAAGTTYTYTGKQAFWYNNDSATYAPMNYGLLYNWNAAVDTFNTAYGETSVNTDYNNAVFVIFMGNRRGICPAGWHLPSDAEWTTLTDYVSGQSEFQCGGNSGNIARALASKTTDWNSSSNTCAVGNNTAANNDAGFSAVPAGCYGSSFDLAGNGAGFWSSTQGSSTYACRRSLVYNLAYVSRSFNFIYNGFSVRCLRDDDVTPTTQVQPSVTTSAATNISSTSATLNGSVSNPDNVTINAQGFEWKATVNSTYTQVIVSNTTMTYNLTRLTANTNYTYRAYVTTAGGTTYGEEINFTTLAAGCVVVDAKSCPSAPTVTDHEGNVYATVQIGNQCWMRDNLRTTTSPRTGTYLIPAAGTTYTYTGKQARWYNNDSATYAPQNYGLLYNWNAAVDTFNTAYGETSVNTDWDNAVSVSFTGNRRGICPAGWHLPSDAEWTQLTDYVGSQSEFRCEGNSSYIAKALASKTTDWGSSSDICAVGNNTAANNDAGFSAVPAGYCYGSSFDLAGYYAGFWSSTQSSSNYAWYRYMGCYNAYVYRNGDSKNYGYSVRCLRD